MFIREQVSIAPPVPPPYEAGVSSEQEQTDAPHDDRRDDRRAAGRAATAEQIRFVAKAEASAAGMTAIVAAPTSFEIVNAAFGRALGDRLVQAMAARLDEVLADYRGVATRAGATFSMLVAGPPVEGDRAAAAVERALGAPFAVDGETIHVGARIGLARMSGGEPVGDLLFRAAGALERARASDGATTRVASEGEGAALAALAADLHRAIERGEIDVLFQPQVAMADGRIIGAEALVRWAHPRLGPLGAERLLAAAERADLGVALSDHVQTLAMARMAQWPASLRGLRVSLNVTAADISRDGFAAQFLDRVVAAGIAPEQVTAEVTESGVIHDLAAANRALAALRTGGCRVALDDFGTGYSSLAYLSQLPLDYLKIDRALTQAIDGDARGRTVIDGVITIAAGLGLETIAEGVETEAQRALLAARGCTYYQGFLCAGAVDDAALARLVEGRR